jgi:hypothetical protein
MTRPTRRYAVLGFATTHDALDAESLLEDLGIEIVPIPAPPSVSGGCGIALRMLPEELDRAIRYLESAGIQIAGKQEIDDV